MKLSLFAGTEKNSSGRVPVEVAAISYSCWEYSSLVVSPREKAGTGSVQPRQGQFLSHLLAEPFRWVARVGAEDDGGPPDLSTKEKVDTDE